EGIKKNLTPEQIDFNVKIDDSYALRGLMTLDQDNINQIEVKSSQLSLMIMEVIEAEKLNGIVVISFTAFIAGFIFWVFSNKIIRPVKHLSMLRHEMSQGNLNIKLNSSHENSRFTEIDMMKRSLHVFKESETKRREAEEEIRHLALTDPLTGLANRNQFESRYNEMIAMAKRENKLLAYLALDLDNFKPINDEYGHLAGDLILKSVAKHLIMAFRETDLIARMGGDEFSVILFGPENQESVEMVCKRVIALIKTPVAFGKDMLSVGISIGIAMHTPEDEDNLELLLGSGDKALYEAKQSGRNTYRVFNAS
ncbi:MAG: diguanylate cyclase, partial [Candidatus Heimdallarchaeota archaeon]|nr:diguanylate cyclase [Candidatus Heimdallarchaeota archaeon]